MSGGLVQHDDRRFLEEEPGDGEPLLLTTGHAIAAVADNGFQSVGERPDQLADVGRLDGRPQLDVGRLGPRVRQVPADAVVGEVAILGHNADYVAHRLQRHVAHVFAADPHRAALDVVHPRHELRDGGLPGAGGPYESDKLAGLGTERHAVQHLLFRYLVEYGDRLQRRERNLGGGRVTEVDVVELDGRGLA